MLYQGLIAEEIGSIIAHLRDSSFESFIDWNGSTCMIKSIDLLNSIVLPTLKPFYRIGMFCERLESINIHYKLTASYIKIDFPEIRDNITKRSRSITSFLKCFDEIEEKQEKLYQSMLTAQEKLGRAILINNQIKNELQKSNQIQIALMKTIKKKDIQTNFDNSYMP